MSIYCLIKDVVVTTRVSSVSRLCVINARRIHICWHSQHSWRLVWLRLD